MLPLLLGLQLAHSHFWANQQKRATSGQMQSFRCSLASRMELDSNLSSGRQPYAVAQLVWKIQLGSSYRGTEVQCKEEFSNLSSLIMEMAVLSPSVLSGD